MIKPSEELTLIAKARKITIELLDSLSRQQGLKSDDLWQLYETKTSAEKFQKERRLLNVLADIIVGANHQISRHLLYEKILYRVIGLVIDYPDLKEETLAELDKTLRNLLIYDSRKDVDVPIVNLELEGKPFRFGPVEFLPITDEDRSGRWWDSVEAALGESTAQLCVVSYGRVLASGDLDTSLSYTGHLVDDALLILRGIAFPFTVEEIIQIGVVGLVSVHNARPYRLGNRKENVKLESPSAWAATMGPPIGPYRLYADLLNKIDQPILDILFELTSTQGFNPTKPMAAKIIGGLRWLGEASKPDALSARFAKLTFALENLIGGESQDQQLSSIGLTAMLAERAAFLSSESQGERIRVDKAVREFYGKRSAIVHGRPVEVNPEDINGFAHLVRGVVGSLLRKLDTIQEIHDLQNWVREQRYL